MFISQDFFFSRVALLTGLRICAVVAVFSDVVYLHRDMHSVAEILSLNPNNSFLCRYIRAEHACLSHKESRKKLFLQTRLNLLH